MSEEVVKRAASKIVIGERHRKDLGDLASLARSIEDVGLLHPVVIDRHGTLIAGERRLRACIDVLKWKDIPVRIIDLDEIVRGEFAENSERKDFLPSEIHAILKALAPQEKAAAKERQGKRTDLTGTSAKVSQMLPKRAVDKLGSFAGVSGRTVEKIAAVMEAAEKEPEKYGKLAKEADRTGKIDGAFRMLKTSRDEERVMELVVAPGRYRALVIDPPWDYEGLSLAGRAAPLYATMTQQELLALPVASWAEDNCHLYLWATNNFVLRAGELMAAWGFEYKTMLTWVKPRIGLGSYFRNSTEQVLFGVRGDLKTRSKSIPTHFEAQMGESSEKPEEFYEIVRAASFEPFGEGFQRKARPDFRNFYEPKK